MAQPKQFRMILLALLLLTIFGVALVPLSTVVPSSDSSAPDTFEEFMYPRLLALTDSVETVESLVAERSRNILALQANAQRIEQLVDQIDTYLTSSGYPDSYNAVVVHYHSGRDAVLAAIDGARSSLRSFDFSGLPSLVTQFSEGTDELEKALSMLDPR